MKRRAPNHDEQLAGLIRTYTQCYETTGRSCPAVLIDTILRLAARTGKKLPPSLVAHKTNRARARDITAESIDP